MQQNKQLLRLVFTLTLLWLLLSGMFKPLLLLLGLASIALVSYLSIKMKVLMHRGQPLYFRFLPVVRYCFWLIGQVLLSNIDVVKRILHPQLPIKPLLKSIPAQQKTEIGRVVFANSITLTPGTVAINIAPDGSVLVHALHEDAIFDLEKGAMGKKVAQLEPRLKAVSGNESGDESGDKEGRQ